MRLTITDGAGVVLIFLLEILVIKGEHTISIISGGMVCSGVFCECYMALIVIETILQWNNGCL